LLKSSKHNSANCDENGAVRTGLSVLPMRRGARWRRRSMIDPDRDLLERVEVIAPKKTPNCATISVAMMADR
jgi:hypothetical protein